MRSRNKTFFPPYLLLTLKFSYAFLFFFFSQLSVYFLSLCQCIFFYVFIFRCILYFHVFFYLCIFMNEVFLWAYFISFSVILPTSLFPKSALPICSFSVCCLSFYISFTLPLLSMSAFITSHPFFMYLFYLFCLILRQRGCWRKNGLKDYYFDWGANRSDVPRSTGYLSSLKQRGEKLL